MEGLRGKVWIYFMAILRNAAKCLDCGQVVESRHRHDWVSCSCGNIFVDGGYNYLRRGFSNANWEELSEFSEEPGADEVSYRQ